MAVCGVDSANCRDVAASTRTVVSTRTVEPTRMVASTREVTTRVVTSWRVAKPSGSTTSILRMTLELRPPRHEDETALRGIHAQMLEENFEFLLAEGEDWGAVLEQVTRESRGVDLPPGRVRADFLVAEVDGVIVGRTSIRYALTDLLREVGGHVGYAVAPEFRRRGHATEILRLSLERLAGAGVDRVLVTGDDTNLGSIRTIERCGGVLDDVRDVGGTVRKRRYWIDVGTQGRSRVIGDSTDPLVRAVLTSLNSLDPYDFEPGSPGGTPEDEYTSEAEDIALHLRTHRAISVDDVDAIWQHWFSRPLTEQVDTDKAERFVDELNAITI